MKRFLSFFSALFMFFVLVGSVAAAPSPASGGLNISANQAISNGVIGSITAKLSNPALLSSTTYQTINPFIVPTLEIVAVDPDVAVTIRTHNFPVGDTFDALLDEYGTLAVNGYVMDTVKTTASSEIFKFDIPEELYGMNRIAIRLVSDTSGYYSYNWFTNIVSKPAATATPKPATTPIPSLPSGVYPSFIITAVTRDGSVSVKTSNLPAKDTFDVYMNTFGTLGIGGTKVDSVSSSSGGTLTFTFKIPSGLTGLQRIAIRMQSPVSRYYVYNWFWNYTFP